MFTLLFLLIAAVGIHGHHKKVQQQRAQQQHGQTTQVAHAAPIDCDPAHAGHHHHHLDPRCTANGANHAYGGGPAPD